MSTDEWVSRREIADKLGISDSGVALLIKRGDLPSVKVGRSQRVRHSDFNAYLNRRSTTPAQRRALLGPETIAYLKKLAEDAPPLTEEQRDTIRAAFRGT